MITALRNAWRNMVEARFSAAHPRRFALRIRLRILALRFRLWRQRPKLPLLRHHWPKPVALLVIGIAVPVGFAWLLGLFFPEEANGLFTAIHELLTDPARAPLEWREAAQILLLLIGVPSAFLLWLFRDINVSGTLENQRKDVNLKEFQEIQMRAAGALDEKLPADARETLQIAALHQLRAFLRGEYGKSFRRPAFELLRARFVASAEATGSQAIRDWLDAWRIEARRDDEGLPDRVEPMKKKVQDDRRSLRRNRVSETERAIVREEWEAVFRSGMPLNESTFEFIRLNPHTLLAGIAFGNTRFNAAFLPFVHFENAVLVNADFAFASLSDAHFEGADLREARFEGADLAFAHLERASLNNARFEGANLNYAKMSWARLAGASLVGASLHGVCLAGAFLYRADLRQAHLAEAELTGAFLVGARLQGAVIPVDPTILEGCREAEFDEATEFAPRWHERAEGEKEVWRAPWIRLGARPAS